MSESAAVRALVFDLYGTLIHFDERPFQRGILRLLDADRRQWIEFLRDVLLVRPFASRDAFLEAMLERFPSRAGDSDETKRRAHELLEREIAAARVEPAARAVLGFLRRRGLQLALLTNSASPFREPLAQFELEEPFDAVLFSCDLGTKKPEAASYRAALDALAVPASAALMVGDSLANDVEGPAENGMRSFRVAGDGRNGSAPGERNARGAGEEGAGSPGRFEDLAWMAGFETGELAPLAEVGRRVELGGLEGRIQGIDLLSDAMQGRYNLVAKVRIGWDEGWSEEAYLKRYRHPEAVYVEEIARELLTELGIETNRIGVLGGREPLMLSRAVTGEKLVTTVPEPELAFEIGRHSGSTFVLANADFRPRNALLTRQGGQARLTMVDYEYMLFDRALDLSDIPDRFDPRSLSKLSASELQARTARRVVARGGIQRTRRAFLDPRTALPEAVARFRDGWREVHERAQQVIDRLEEILRARLEREPPLVVGTESYRRAFLPIDIADLRERIAVNPDAACDLCF